MFLSLLLVLCAYQDIRIPSDLSTLIVEEAFSADDQLSPEELVQELRAARQLLKSIISASQATLKEDFVSVESKLEQEMQITGVVVEPLRKSCSQILG